MKGVFQISESKFEVNFAQGTDISIPLDFNGEQPNTYGVQKASSVAFKDNQFIGDTREGGPCNFETYSFTPHCNGTHTECIGHITNERVSIVNSLTEELIPSTLISLTPRKTNEKYVPELNKNDLVITKEDLEKCLVGSDSNFLKAIIIRTMPNLESKMKRNYMKEPSSFFSIEAMQYIVDLGVQHLLIDTPSVDRLFDEGFLTAHNIFWETKGRKINLETKNKTITEMIFVPDSLHDGVYLLNLQIPAFVSDAAPSRPVLYSINEL